MDIEPISSSNLHQPESLSESYKAEYDYRYNKLCSRFILRSPPPDSNTSKEYTLPNSKRPTLLDFVAYALHRTKLHSSTTLVALYLMERLKRRPRACTAYKPDPASSERPRKGHRDTCSCISCSSSRILKPEPYASRTNICPEPDPGLSPRVAREEGTLETEDNRYTRDKIQKVDDLGNKSFLGKPRVRTNEHYTVQESAAETQYVEPQEPKSESNQAPITGDGQGFNVSNERDTNIFGGEFTSVGHDINIYINLPHSPSSDPDTPSEHVTPESVPTFAADPHHPTPSPRPHEGTLDPPMTSSHNAEERCTPSFPSCEQNQYPHPNHSPNYDPSYAYAQGSPYQSYSDTPPSVHYVPAYPPPPVYWPWGWTVVVTGWVWIPVSAWTWSVPISFPGWFRGWRWL